MVPDPAKASEVYIDPNGSAQKHREVLRDSPFGVWLRAADAPQALRDDTTRRDGKWVLLRPEDEHLLPKSPETRQVHRAVGPIIAGATCMITADTLRNRFNALMLRVFRQLDIVVDPLVWEHMRSLASVLTPRLLAGDFKSMDIMEWWPSMPAARRKPLMRAIVMYYEQGWCDKFAEFSAFIKKENLPFFSKDRYGLRELDYSAPRLIQGPHDVIHVILGRHIKPMLTTLKEDWPHTGPLFYGSTTPDKLQKWLDRATSRYPSGLIFWSDYSMFDSSYELPHWDFVESFYTPFSSDPDVRSALQAIRTPGGRCGNFKYQGPVMNASGRDDTALANGLLNGYTLFVSAAASWYEKPILDVTQQDLTQFGDIVMISCAGDDAIGVLPWMNEGRRLKFVQDLKKNIATCGFKAKVFAADQWQYAVYLGHRPLQLRGGWVWSRTTGRCLYKLGWQAELVGDPLAWMTGVMDMHVTCSSHVPVLADIAKAWVKGRKGCKRTPVQQDPNKPWEWMNVVTGTYDESTLKSFASAYSVHRDSTRGDLTPCDVVVTTQDVLDCIKYCVDRLSIARTVVLDHWLLKHMVWVDEQ